ncbi:MAG: hypothetical protein GOMPHAMPRED_007362 [Gomphillus americanus]|uniref:Crh-like protein n=1 Tax=Gomphillus americanus TaxID=1940652 RepID=A0A8H3ES87_9LECA|nr:MAG: hypothetical protein GOMPHAMPRED_007362 [Gomphillus americanus]
MRSTQYLTAVAALVAPTLAQTFTSCNPLEKACPANPALGKSVAYNFASGAPSDFTVAAGKAPVFSSDGAHFTIAKDGDAPTVSSNWYMMFGHYKIVMKPAPGAGIVSSLVLLSDDLDEVDWEWVGSQGGKVQTNYFGKGNTTVYDRGLTLSDGTKSDGFNTYELDWTAEHVQWIINGNVVRTLTPATADYNQYPQSPMQLKIGNWPAGDSSNAGTSQWAGGNVQWSQGPFDMIVKSVEVSDYSTGKSYSYSGTSGTWESIKSDGGAISGSGSAPSSVTTASASGTTIAASSTAIAITNQPLPITTVSAPTGQLGSGSGSPTGSTSSTLVTTTPSATSGSGSGSSGSGSGGSGSGSGSNATVAVTPTSSSSSSGSNPSTGAGIQLKPLAGLAAVGLLAVVAL